VHVCVVGRAVVDVWVSSRQSKRMRMTCSSALSYEPVLPHSQAQCHFSLRA
jgi:hypothetical protein